jgi:VWFA-related protein
MEKPKPLALILAATLAVAPGLLPPGAAQSQPRQEAPPPAAPPTFAVGTSTVAVDVVVRDKKGRLVKDLTASDFEITEEGARQQIESFVVIARGAEAEPAPAEPETAPAAAPAAAAPPAAPPVAAAERESDDTPHVVALVFDRMSPQSRDLARTAAQTYLAARRDGDFVGVFSIDLALHTVQNFTDDSERIRSAIDVAAGQAGTSFVSTREQAEALQSLEMRARDAESQVTATPVGNVGGAAALAGGAAAERDIARLTAGMLRSFEALERDQQGFATTNGLLAVVQGLQRVPGRKTVVFFSEGMAIPDRVLAQFQSVIANANRANVAVYTMDAGGLRTHSPTEETRAALATAEAARFRNLGREDQGLLMKDAEENENLLRLNPQSGLGMLAEQTGGFLVRDTNDARGAFRRIAQDMRFHYVLGYTPSNQDYDGRFRRVSVKVRRGGLNVQSRQGYYAVRPGTSNPLLGYEAPAIAVLDRPGPRPEAFPFRGMALTFPQDGSTVKVPVLVRVPGRAIKFAPEKGQKDVVAADLAVVVRVRNEYQQEVSRVSQRYQLSSPAAKLDAARAGDILFYREAELPPGKYTLDAVAYDAGASVASVKSFPLDVPGPSGTGCALSSLVLIERVERVSEADRDASNPLYYGEALVYPNMGDPYRKAARVLGYYFTALSPGNARKAVLEVAQGNQVTGRLTMDLPPPDAKGRLQHAGTLPLDGFAPGSYELRITLMDGGQRVASRTASFTVAE